jgi:hypothetical protein
MVWITDSYKKKCKYKIDSENLKKINCITDSQIKKKIN